MNAELAELVRDNSTIKHARYPYARRLLDSWIIGRRLFDLVAIYGLLLGAVCAADVVRHSYLPVMLPKWTDAGFLKDLGSYFISAQVGMLAIVSVAVGVVTLLSQRDDGSTVNTDIRLYYVQSYAYEVVTSGVALLLILIVQLFWPAQSAMQSYRLVDDDLTSRLVLTIAHAAWLSLNFVLFLQFITTTLRFVEPTAREQMREDYSANVVIPRDIAKRLLAALHMTASGRVFGESEIEAGPDVRFGYAMFGEEAETVEVERHFETRAQLDDVWFAPLTFVVNRWRARSRKLAVAPTKQMFGDTKWDGNIAFPLTFGSDLEGLEKVVLRTGGAPLKGWERWVLAQCFRYSPIKREIDLPTPADFMEELADKLVGQIEKSANTGFRAALREIVRYHRFILAAQNVKDEEGKPFNLSEVGGSFQRPDEEWVRQYRRVYYAAAGKISDDPDFMEWIGTLPAALIPADAPTFSRRPLLAIVELGIFEVLALEAWVSSHTLPSYDPEAGSTIRLAATDQRPYERVLISFVGSWESFAQQLRIAFEVRKVKKLSEENAWASVALCWPSLQKHLECSAFFLLSAVWNEDEAGADRFRDLLLRWLSPFYDEMRNDYDFDKRYLFSPAVMSLTWREAASHARVLRSFDRDSAPAPQSILGLSLRTALEDVITLSAALSLSWRLSGQQATDIGGRTADKLLRRQTLAGEGSDLAQATLRPRSPFKITLDFIWRHALNPKFAGDSYSAKLDGLVQWLASVASRRMVSGRVYSDWQLQDVDALRVALLAILAAHLPPEGVALDQSMIDAAIAEGQPLHAHSKMRSAIFAFEAYRNALGESVETNFAVGVQILNPTADVIAAHRDVRALLTATIEALTAAQLQRLAAAKLDPAAVQRARAKLSDEIIENGPEIFFLRGFEVARGIPSKPIQTRKFGYVDKASYVDPPLSDIPADDTTRIMADAARSYLGQAVWSDFSKRPQKKRRLAFEGSRRAFWKTIIDFAQSIDEEPTLLIEYGDLAEGIGLASQGVAVADLADFALERREGLTGGAGAAYMGTIDGVDVFTAQVGPKIAYLFSGTMLSRVTYGVVTDDGLVADFEFVDDAKPSEAWVLLKLAQSTEWRATEVLVLNDRAPAKQKPPRARSVSTKKT